MSNQFEFASPDWLDMLEDSWTSFAPTLPSGTKLTMTETYTQVPPHIAGQDGGAVTWTCRLDAPDVRFLREAVSDADLSVTADYHAIADMVRLAITPETNGTYEQMAAALFTSGKISVSGDPAAADFARPLHNAVAARTL